MRCPCGFQSGVTQELREHFKNKHNYSEDNISKIIGRWCAEHSSIECGICQKRCPSPRDFFIHLIDAHQYDPLSAFDDVALAVQDYLAGK